MKDGARMANNWPRCETDECTLAAELQQSDGSWRCDTHYVSPFKAHETRGYNDGLWQTYNGQALDGDARDAYDVGYEQGCDERERLGVREITREVAR